MAVIVVMRIGRNRSRQASEMARSGDIPSRSRVIAKSTSMMPFFLTMPISKMIPMMPMTERSRPAAHNASNAPTLADGRVERIVSGWM
jgi:hypothetical protein